MLDGVSLLLERMKTHPEEFIPARHLGDTKWTKLVDYYEGVLTEHEKSAIKTSIKQLMREQFTQEVMKEILREPSEGGGDASSYGYTVSANNSPGNWGITSIQEQAYKAQAKLMQLELQKAMVEEYKEKLVGKKEKNKSKMEQLLTNITKRKQVY